VARLDAFGRHQIDCSNNHPEQQFTQEDTPRPEVDVPLHDMPDADTGVRSEGDSRVSGYQVAAARGGGFVWPDRTRNNRLPGVPDRFTACPVRETRVQVL